MSALVWWAIPLAITALAIGFVALRSRLRAGTGPDGRASATSRSDGTIVAPGEAFLASLPDPALVARRIPGPREWREHVHGMGLVPAPPRERDIAGRLGDGGTAVAGAVRETRTWAHLQRDR